MCCIFFVRVKAQGTPLCPTAKDRVPTLISVVTRSQLGFTEGLLWHDGSLYESTGAFGGPSIINQINPQSGIVTPLVSTPGNTFGEGLTFSENRFFQLTWKNRTAFIYSPKLQLKKVIPFSKDGWGLTNDGENLISSDGSSHLYFSDPKTLEVSRSLMVHDQDGNPYNHLNALAYANSAIYSNVFQTDQILKTDPSSGCVVTRYDLGNLRSQLSPRDLAEISKDPNNNVPNGIAFDPNDRNFYVTGKNWWTIFKVGLPD